MRLPFLTASLILLPFVPIVASSDSSPDDPASSHAEFEAVNPGSAAPDFTEKDIYGRQTIALSAYRGKVVMLNFWATWCPPCREEIPALESLQRAYGARLVIIGASVYSTDANTELVYWEYKINYLMIYGSYDLMGKYDQVAVIPTTFIIDKEGKISSIVVGSRTQNEYEEILRPLLSK